MAKSISYTPDWEALSQAAKHAQNRAYAPYSLYRVGAAALGDDGQTYIGCNVENASYGLSMCAERSAVFQAVLGGAHAINAVVLYTDGATPATPCGACRQVISEFATDCTVLCISRDGDRIMTTVRELLPHAFGPHTLPR
ncbi:MAG: cytidine deaminase [Myxococcales bacterium]|nr:cytidine deaminase [Myxococcales bacterium]